MEITYPSLRLPLITSLLALQRESRADPGVLKGENCPYDTELVAALDELFAVVKVEVLVKAPEGGGKGRPRGEEVLKKLRSESAEIIERELQQVQEDLKTLRDEAKDLAPNDRIQIIKTAAALVEKLTTLSERQFNIKRMSLFQSRVLSVLDDLITPENRSVFMAKMATFAEEE